MTWGPSNWNGLTPARPDATPARPDITLARQPTAGATPAQAHGHPSFVVDVPVQGPTDEGMRAASCWWAQNRLPANPACVDCNGPIPQWTRNTLCPGNRLTNSGVGEPPMFSEAISFGGRRARAFGIGADAPTTSSDPGFYATLTPDQQYWVGNVLRDLNSKIMLTTGTTCDAYVDPGVNINGPVNCFQQWYNANYGADKIQGGVTLPVNGFLDQMTLTALQTVASANPSDFPTPWPTGGAAPAPAPGPSAPPAPPAPPAPGTTPATVPSADATKKGLSTGEMVGIGVAGAAVLGGIVYAATRKPSRRRRR